MIYSNNRTKLSYDPQYTALVEAYYNVVDNDYQLFSEAEVLTEAFDVKKIKDRLVKGIGTLLKKFGELINAIVGQIKKLAKQIKAVYHQAKYDNLAKKINKAFPDDDPYKTVIINAPELADGEDFIAHGFYEIYDRVFEIFMQSSFLHNFDIDFSKDMIEDKINSARDEFNQIYDEYSAQLKDYENYDTDQIFFKDVKSKNYKVDGSLAVSVWFNLYNPDVNSDLLAHAYQSNSSSLKREYDFYVKNFDDLSKYVHTDNGTKEQEEEYKTKLSAEYASWALDVFQKGCAVLSNFNTKVLASYKKYLDANKEILKKILKAAKINPNSKEDSIAISPEFEKAVKEKNLLRVRIMLKDEILIDRKTLKNFNQMLDYAKSKLPDLIEEDDGNEKLYYGKKYWTEDYFNTLSVAVVTNFSREKIKLLCDISHYLFMTGIFT